MSSALTLWQRWADKQRIAQSGVPLFACSDALVVKSQYIGTSTKRSILCRSTQMEQMVIDQANLLTEDWKSGSHKYDGLIYIMFSLRDAEVVPLYIGKAESLGKRNGNLSANLVNLHTDRTKFARWGDGYQYHIGDLSAASLSGHAKEKISPKYRRWAEVLFEDSAGMQPKLKTKVYLWVKAWSATDVGIWSEMSPTRLAFLEYLLIGVASCAFGTTLLNNEGHNRMLPTDIQ